MVCAYVHMKHAFIKYIQTAECAGLTAVCN